MELLAEDAFHPALRTHKLKGRLARSWPCSAGYDLRIVFQLVQHEGAEAILLDGEEENDLSPAVIAMGWLQTLSWHGMLTIMSTKMIEQQLADLRNRVATLEARVQRKSRNGWIKLAGWAKDDPIYDEAMRLGAEWRKRENRKSLKDAGRR